jgi:hypothetical protein
MTPSKATWNGPSGPFPLKRSPPPTADGQSKTKRLFASAMSMWRNHKKIMFF